MSEIRVRLKSGEERVFPDRGAPGGSYSNSMRFEPGFVVVADAYGNETALSDDDIVEIYHESSRSF